MRTLQEKYNAIQEGKFSKEHFLAEARMQQPQLITRFNGYDDAVQILKNKGMIQEAVKENAIKAHMEKLIQAAKTGNKTKESILAGFAGADIKYKVTNAEPNVIKYWNDEQGLEGEIKLKEPVNEAKLTEAKVYSFTLTYNDAKYVQRVLDDAGVDAVAKAGTFDDEVIIRAFDGMGLRRAKQALEADHFDINENVSEAKQPKATKKGLADYRYKPTNEMDKYPYEQILRGLRVELEVMGISGTPTPEEYAKALAKVSKNLAKDSIFYTNQLAGVNPKVDQHDQMVNAAAKNTVDTFNGMKKAELKEGFKKLIKKVLSEEVIDVESYKEGVYEMQGPKSDAEYKRELENYLEDNQIYGYTNMLFDILTAPDEEQVADNLADFLDDHQIYGYNKGLLAIFRDYANRDQSEDEWDEADYERMSNSLKEDEDLFESKSLKDLL